MATQIGKTSTHIRERRRAGRAGSKGAFVSPFRRAPALLAGASLLCLLVGLLYLALQIRTIFSDQLKQEYAGLVLEAAERAESARAMVGVWQQHAGDSQALVQA